MMRLPDRTTLDPESLARISAAAHTVPPLSPEAAARLAKALRLREYAEAKAAQQAKEQRSR